MFRDSLLKKQTWLETLASHTHGPIRTKDSHHEATPSLQESPPFCWSWDYPHKWKLRHQIIESCKINASASSHTPEFLRKWKCWQGMQFHIKVIRNEWLNQGITTVAAWQSCEHTNTFFLGRPRVPLNYPLSDVQGDLMLKPGEGVSHQEDVSLNSLGFCLY